MKKETSNINILTGLTERIALTQDPQKAVVFQYKNESWEPVSASTLDTLTRQAACALEILGIEVQDRIGIFSSNRLGCIVADFAAYALRAVPVSLYATSSADQVRYIVRDASAKVLFVGSDSQLTAAMSIAGECPSLTHIIGLSDTIAAPKAKMPEGVDYMSYADFLALGAHASEKCREAVARRTAEATDKDIATLIYTSGTTGEPKGAILTHSCFNACMEMHRRWLTNLDTSDTSLCFLPLSHIFEKAWTYFCLYRGIQVYINTDPREIQRAIKQVRPTCMCSVPRFWEKAYAGIQEKISEMGAMQRALVRRALSIGRRRNLHYKRLGLKVPRWLEMRYRFYDRRVFATMRRAVGIDRGKMFPTAGAPLSPEIVEFFQSAGVNVIIGYGLS
ncbi:MAG: AMP-binding protein, partial [Muribaculaceae bacterium]|nr:AMP-binding protein [Muribaculaceae bacterium]